MQNWSEEMWHILLIGLIAGFFIGYLVARFTNGSVRKQKQVEQQLQQAKETISEQKQQLEQHFTEASDLMKTLAQDYHKLYQHFASTSTTLLPNLDKAVFTAIEDDSSAKTLNIKQQPKDYSEGSSGLFKQES
ncbi:DUF1043 family protein [Gallibacterium anatis]|uniref:Z-ring associated protein G n=1 Tax=Gallibacterium genomosp. 1 TaxID=155515 RepID=A0A0A2Y1B7_9PAST|nr:DUF1043 family protein [Gallibacterium genomosp. 1]KGQ38448.1 hypothetical protein JP36_03075 [Gallibacterium genomosp. 1]OBX01789.1 hypothetical protein QV04_04710 [Gallibacterium genomosp. 1]